MREIDLRESNTLALEEGTISDILTIFTSHHGA
jgi:hypothetical protein